MIPSTPLLYDPPSSKQNSCQSPNPLALYYYLQESATDDPDLSTLINLLRDPQGIAGARLQISIVKTNGDGQGFWFSTERRESPTLFHALSQPYAALFTSGTVVNLGPLHPAFTAIARLAKRTLEEHHFTSVLTPGANFQNN